MQFCTSHIFTSEKIKSRVCYCLQNHIKSYQIIWRKDKCNKCGLVGDKRFCNDILCHTKPAKGHKKNVIGKHLGIIDSQNHLKMYHKGKLRYFHPKQASKYYHPSCETRYMHPNNLAAYFYRLQEDDEGAVKKAINYVSSPIIGPLNSLLHELQDKCCFCSQDRRDTVGCLEVYKCCGEYVNKYPNGCKAHADNSKKYECCGELFKSDYKSDCNGNKNVDQDNIEKPGCHYYYDCCPENKLSINYKSHDEKDEELNISDDNAIRLRLYACSTKCSHCDTDLDLDIKGAVVDQTDKSISCDTKVNENNNFALVIMNKNSFKDDKHCGFHWPCCDSKGNWKDKDSDDIKCYKFCNQCNGEWGSSPGCVLPCKGIAHDFIAINE